MYFEGCLHIRDCQRPFVTDRDIERFKSAGGYNNDWELTYGMIKMFLNYIPPTKVIPIKLDNIPRIIKFLRFIGPQLQTTGNKLLAKKNVPRFLECRNQPDEKAHRPVLLFNQGELHTTNLIKRIFQEYYLGKEIFTQVYHRRTLLYDDKGYIDREEPFITHQQLDQLQKKYKLGIVTGRPLVELEYSLRKFNLEKYFSVIVAQDDVVIEEVSYAKETSQPISLGKPHPFSLLLAADQLGLKPDDGVAYLGDVTDDVLAANAAKSSHPFVSVGVLQAAKDPLAAKHKFETAGADYVIERVSDVLNLF